MTIPKAHDFRIDVFRKLVGKTVFVARCVEPGCAWITGELATRTKAVTAAHWHQATEEIKKL